MTTEIRFGGYQGDNSVHTRAGRVLAEALAEYSDGAATLAFVENITEDGHKAADLLAMTEAGELDGCYFSTSYLTGRVPDLGVFDQHFAVPDRQQAYRILDGVIGERLKRRVGEQTGFALMGFWDNGVRHISSRKPIRTPADCEGLSIRTLANEDHQRVFAALGFTPKAIDVRDLAEAVKTGVVDAQENPLTNIVNFGLHKFQPYVTLTGHLLGLCGLFFNAEKVARWDEKLVVAMNAAIARATHEQRKFAQEEDMRCTEVLEADGATIIALTDEERFAFAEATRDAVALMRTQFDPDLVSVLDRALDPHPAPQPF